MREYSPYHLQYGAFIHKNIACLNDTSNILCILSKAAPNAASPIYGAAVVMATTTAIATELAAPYISPIAVVAQGRAPAKGDMGARPIYGICC